MACEVQDVSRLASALLCHAGRKLIDRTAEQAEAMLEPMHKSLEECMVSLTFLHVKCKAEMRRHFCETYSLYPPVFLNGATWKVSQVYSV